MLRVLATTLLLLQLRPIAAAAACMVGQQPAAACEMTSTAAPARSHHHSAPPATPMPPCDCPAALACGVSITAIIASFTCPAITVARRGMIARPGSDTPHTAEPVTPPVPPPNA